MFTRACDIASILGASVYYVDAKGRVGVRYRGQVRWYGPGRSGKAYVLIGSTKSPGHSVSKHHCKLSDFPLAGRRLQRRMPWSKR